MSGIGIIVSSWINNANLLKEEVEMIEKRRFVSRTLAILMMACMVIFGTVAMTATTYANEGGGIEFQKDGEVIEDDMLFTNEVMEYYVDYDDEDASSPLDVKVYYSTWDEELDDTVVHELTEDAWYYDEQEQLITMYGDKCWNELNAYDDSAYSYNVTVRVWYENLEGYDEEAFLNVDVRKLTVDYEYPWITEDYDDDEDAWAMYTGEERSIYSEGRVYVLNRDYPDGEWLSYEVTDVTSDAECISVSREDAESNWVVRAEEEGQTQLTIEYQPIDSDDVDTFTVDIEVKNTVYGVSIERTDEGGSNVLPGSYIGFTAYGYSCSGIAEDEEEYEYEYDWSVEGKATIETDPDDSSCATVTVDENADDGDIVEVKVIMKNGEDEVLAENTYELEVLSEYDELFISDVNDYAFVGESQKITAEYRHYDMETPRGVKKDGWTVTCTNVEPAGAATVRPLANDLNGNFEITRKSAEWFKVNFTAKSVDGEDEETRTIYFNNSPSTNLSDWDLAIFDVNDDQVYDRIYVDGKEGEARLSSIILRWDGEIDLDYNKYDLTMEKESIGPDGNLIYTPVRIGDKLQPGENGTTTYRITAKAKAGSGFTGSCFRYLDVCDRYSLNGFNADVTFEVLGKPNAVGERPMRDYYLVLMDELSGVYPEVSIDDGNLNPDTDYDVSYVLESQEDDPNAPVYDALDEITEPGVYVCRIVGKGLYHGTSDTAALNVVKDEEAYEDAENAYAFSDMIEEIIASIYDGESLDTVKKTTSDARSMLKGEGPDALSPAVIAAVPERVKGMLTSAEKYIEFKETVKTIDPANPKQDAVQKARSAYNAIQNDLKDMVDTADLNRLTSAEKKITDDKAAADARAAAEAKAKMVKTVTINVKTVNAKAVNSAVQKAGGSSKYVTKFVLGKKVKSIKKGAFTSYKKATTLELKTKKLKKKTVKNSLKGTKVKTVKVNVGSKKVNKKFVKTYKKIFTKKIVGKKVKIK